MTTDKVFILLLVIMLPLTGCLDMTDNAEAQVEPDSTADTVTSLPMIHSLHIEAGESHVLAFDGSNTMILEDAYSRTTDDDCSSNCPEVWSHYNNGLTFSMDCTTIVIENVRLQDEVILPVLGGEACNVTLNAQYEVILMFSEANLASL